jgi:hypothetical protein
LSYQTLISSLLYKSADFWPPTSRPIRDRSPDNRDQPNMGE